MKTSKGKKITWLAILGAAAVGAVFAVVSIAGPGQTAPSSCCIAGNYRGHRADQASPSCLEPKTDDVSMSIKQEKDCSPRVWGEVLGDKDKGMPAIKWDGTVKKSASSENCCDFYGKFVNGDETVEWKIVLCYEDGKWSGKGSYKQTRGFNVCLGTLTLRKV